MEPRAVPRSHNHRALAADKGCEHAPRFKAAVRQIPRRRESQAEVEELIKPAGFYRSKAKNIIAISRRIIQRPDGKVPDNIEELLALPMVGRKTANCVLSYGFDIDAICVDTHVHRICNRIGLVQTPEADVTEAELRKVVPMDLWKEVNMRMVPFGQDVCLPRNPRCPACPIKKHCDYGRDL
jgi:endonuclease-3